MAIKDWHWMRVGFLWGGGIIAVLLILGLADAYGVPRPPAPQGVLLVGLVYGIAVGILAITCRWLWVRRLGSQVLGLVVVVAVFVLSFYLARSDAFGLRQDDAIPFAAAATILITFLYWRIAKRFNL